MPPQEQAGLTGTSYAANEDRLVQLKIQTEKMEHASRRIGMLLKLPLGLLWILLLGWLALIVWNAWGSRGIVVDGFNVPPSVAATGLDGDTIAARIRAQILDMQSATPSSTRIGLQLDNRAEDNPIEIPQIGVSLGETNRAIRNWLGSDARVRGDISGQGNAFVLRLRIDETVVRIPQSPTAPTLDDMITQASERIFQKLNPYRYATYLWSKGRAQESTREFVALSRRRVSKTERAWALNGLAANLFDLGRCGDAIPILEHAARLGPEIPNIHGNLRNAHVCLGHDQQAADATAEELRLLWHAGDQLDSERIAWLQLQDEDNLSGQHGDYGRRLAILDQMEERGDGDFSMERAQALAGLRDVRASNRLLRQWYAFTRWDADALRDGRTAYWRVRYAQAVSLGLWREAAGFAAKTSRLVQTTSSAFDREQLRTADLPLEAIALARAGDAGGGAAIANGLPLDCYLCVRSRAFVAEAAGDRAGADRWFAAAVALGPRLPFAYAEWGETLLRRGDAAAALGRFDQARLHGPEYADAHKGHGDALHALGRYGEAVRSYGRAASRAPRWGELHLAWAGTLWRLGRRDAAREKLNAAAGMDLSPSDQVRLRQMQAVARRLA